MTWDGSKGGGFWKIVEEEKKMKHGVFLKNKNRRVGGTYSKKP